MSQRRRSNDLPEYPPSAGDGETSATGLVAQCSAQHLNAYFATKVVTEMNGTTTVRLDRINTHVLGRVLYVVVESPVLRSGTSVTIILKTNDPRLTDVAHQALQVTNGTTDVESFTAQIGDTSALNDNTDACAYSNLAEFANKAIFKIFLRPHVRANFDAWASKIKAAGQNLPSIRVEVSSSGEMGFCADPLASLTIENKKVYEVYHAKNAYNFLRERGRISHIENEHTDNVSYYFFDIIDNCHMICEVVQSRVRRRKNGVKHTSPPTGHIDSAPAPAGGNAQMNYYYNRPGDTATKSPPWRYFGIATKGNASSARVVRYDLASNDENDMVDLIQMPDNLNYNREEGANRVRATFSFSNTRRRFCNPGCFAGFLGVLIQLGRRVTCTGMCFGDATSYPSVTHPNGDSVDTAYLQTNPPHDEQAKIDAFKDYYFTNILRGEGGWMSGLQNSKFKSDHETHLHAGDFDVGKIDVLNHR